MPTAPAARPPTVGISIDGQLRFVGATLPARISALSISADPAFVEAWLRARTVRWESDNPAVVEIQQAISPAESRLFLRAAGGAEITVWVDGVRSSSMLIEVKQLPPASTALVVERFSLFDFADPFAPNGSHSYMPMIRLREPSGVASPAVVGVFAAMPTAPPTGWCVPNPVRVWAPGSAKELLGLDRYFGEPEFWFGPYTTSAPIGPVEVILIVRDELGTLGSIILSKTMTLADITTVAPTVQEESHLGCY